MPNIYDAAKQQAWQQTGNYGPDGYAVVTPGQLALNPMLATGSAPLQQAIGELIRYQATPLRADTQYSTGPKNRLAGLIGEGPTMSAIRRGQYTY